MKRPVAIASIALAHVCVTRAMFEWGVRLYVDRFFGPKPSPPVPLLHRCVDWAYMVLTLPCALFYYDLPPEWHRDWTWYCMLAVNAAIWAFLIYWVWSFWHRRPINPVQPTATRSAAGGG